MNGCIHETEIQTGITIELKYGDNLECSMRGKIGSHDIFACTAKKNVNKLSY